ncbi:helix-turn-helix domain-containing protein [Streptomyces phaeochromogenes]|uniref:helix-turn-helix domain-containing protein n=1 Tax=Streptomyces phaeochromogenes TaxID=1923 RepID=UPI00225596D1|nr:helix-turn-helix transcriptional regulator [Streptomyces phaeochromogenes]MCX5601645.1 helix-turn-helix domain-containing protein [Streptomyces phaeochromogenes]
MPKQESEWSVQRRREIGERIRTVRRHRKLTQEQLAHQIGLDRRSIHRYETALRDPALSMLLRIARGLQVDLSVLVADNPDIPRSDVR